MKRMLREFSKSSAATTLLEAFVASTATNVAILDSQGKEIFALGSLPFLCQIIHNKDARVCPDTCRLHESHPRFECDGGLMTLSAPLLVNNERAGTLVARGLRTNSSTPKLTSIAEQIGVEEGELVDEFQ
ncbi:MAG TPA: PocR ligand-binding domain-containing protein, partial [Candidatus Nanoarchaeia archaeon]|nr:PocR ligand-binding domain-containing protein [Candidatus Nanoarchaeia archaeon]